MIPQIKEPFSCVDAAKIFKEPLLSQKISDLFGSFMIYYRYITESSLLKS
jgi:hypothetical protein